MPELDGYARQALDHIRVLSEQIGGRGSCTAGEQRAAEYAAGQMRAAGAQDVRIEPFLGAPSTYRPFALAFAVALLGTVLAWLAGGRVAMGAAALLSALGAWGMLAETNLDGNWLRRVLPRAGSRNAVGRVGPSGEIRRQAVVCAHLDTHRTPVFYSSRTWYLLFGLLVGAAFASMALNAIVYLLAALFGWDWLHWIGLAATAMQVFALVLCLHADRTPFSPGANDNASGVGTLLAVARRLAIEPLAHTQVWLACTGCEEVGAYGMAAFLDAHAPQIGPEAVYIIIDQVAVGQLMYLTADGLILKHKTHPRALGLAGRVDSRLPALKLRGQVGIAYTDALVATKRGLVALTLCAVPQAPAADTMHWHRMSDTPANVEPQALAAVHSLTWELLQEIDRS